MCSHCMSQLSSHSPSFFGKPDRLEQRPSKKKKKKSIRCAKMCCLDNLCHPMCQKIFFKKEAPAHMDIDRQVAGETWTVHGTICLCMGQYEQIVHFT